MLKMNKARPAERPLAPPGPFTSSLRYLSLEYISQFFNELTSMFYIFAYILVSTNFDFLVFNKISEKGEFSYFCDMAAFDLIFTFIVKTKLY